jgi:hypothetical protein
MLIVSRYLLRRYRRAPNRHTEPRSLHCPEPRAGVRVDAARRGTAESERAAQGRIARTTDYAEGITAFQEKRRRTFSGR